MRSPADADIMVVDITNRCMLACSNCTRAIAHQTHTREMTPEYFREVLQCLKGWYQPGRVVGLIGGEPTLHSQFEELCLVFQEEWNPGQDCTHGRGPIGDFNQFAIQRLHDRSNGRGLWTSFGPRFRNHAEVVYDTFSHWNPNDHSQGGVHQTGLVDAREMCQHLGIPWEDFPQYRDNCWVQNTWSAGITPKGNYFCEHAGTIDLLLTGGKLAWKNEPDWWKRTPDQFGEQLSLCEHCALCLPGPSRKDSLDTDVLGDEWTQKLQELGSPAVKRGNFVALSDLKAFDKRTITTKDNYVGESGIRVAADNKHVRPKKLSMVVVAVGQGSVDQLQQTFEKNRHHFDEIVVVSDPDYPFRFGNGLQHKDVFLKPHMEDAFNKGYYLNAGLGALKDPEWIIFTDADILLASNLREAVFSHSWNPGCLYYTQRTDQTSPPEINSGANGFFQMWNPRAKSLRHLGERGEGYPPRARIMSHKFCSAGGIDSWFADQYPEEKRIFVPDLAVKHLEHGEFSARWNGQRTDPCWKQIGILWNYRFVPCGTQLPFDMRDGSCPIRLTDTKFALQYETNLVKGDLSLEKVLEFRPDGATFLGKDIGRSHVHVAARF